METPMHDVNSIPGLSPLTGAELAETNGGVFPALLVVLTGDSLLKLAVATGAVIGATIAVVTR